jgi:hypothetical protein
MFKKTILAAAAAAVIAATSLAATTTTASATYNYGTGHYVTKVVYVPKKHCEPVYKQVKWQDYYGQWHWKTVHAGESCKTFYVKAYKKVWVPPVTYTNTWKPHYGWKPQYGWKAY